MPYTPAAGSVSFLATSTYSSQVVGGAVMPALANISVL